MSDVTCILGRASQGGGAAADELLPVVYEELRKLAAARMAQESAGQTLQPTALVREAWLRLIAGDDKCWNSRGHFSEPRLRPCGASSLISPPANKVSGTAAARSGWSGPDSISRRIE